MGNKKTQQRKPVSAAAIKAVVIDNDNNREANPQELALIARREEFQQLVVSPAQFTILFQPTPPEAKRQREGPGGAMLDYIPHGYAEDRLNKAFGIDWDFEIIPNAFSGMPFHLTIEEREIGQGRNAKTKTSRSIAVIGRLTCRVRNPKTLEVITTIVKTATGSNPWHQNIEFGDAMKSAESDAFKRCCLRVGIGLDLYYDEDRNAAKAAEQAEKEAKLEEARQTAQAAKAKAQAPKSIPELVVKVKQAYNWGIAELLANTGAATIADLTAMLGANPAALWERIVQQAAANVANTAPTTVAPEPVPATDNAPSDKEPPK